MTVAAAAQTLTLTRTLNAPVAQVYRAFTTVDGWNDWFADNTLLRAEVGGPLFFTWDTGYYASCVYTALEKDQQVAFKWRGAGETTDSHIEISLQTAGEQVELTLTLSDFNPAAESVLRHEWNKRLNGLQEMLEVGSDYRITKRVIIGIIPGVYNAEVAEKLGVPSKEGTLVTDVIEGRSAAAAGLQPNDVVVAINGQPVNEKAPIGVLVGDRQPGDEVEVTYYRGAEKQTATLTLGGYPVPNLPMTPAGLAAYAEKLYADLNHELVTIFNGVTEEQAARQPAPAEWSAKENLAHLIITERWLHLWMSSLVRGTEITIYVGNEAPLITGIVEAYPDFNGLLAELQRHFAETVGTVRHYPADIHKTHLWWVGLQIDGFADHMRRHFRQMREALGLG